MSDVTWEEGPWLVEVTTFYEVGDCGAETARRAALADTHGRTELKHDESWPTIFNRKSTRTRIHPLHHEPFDVDSAIDSILEDRRG